MGLSRTRISLFYDILIAPLCDVSESFTRFMEFSIHVIRVAQMEGNIVKDNKMVNVNLLFYGCKSSHYLGHREDDMLQIILK